MRNPRNEALAPADDDGADGHGPERTCVLTRQSADKAELIRLVLGPDGQVHPDVRAKAPGRGAWIGVSRPELETAIAKGKLKGALSRAFKTQSVVIPDDLPEKIEQALARASLDRLGMEARSGTLINGADKVERGGADGQGPSSPPCRRRRGRWLAASSTRRGGSAGPRRLVTARVGNPGFAHHLEHGARTGKCGTCCPDRPESGRARAWHRQTLACFHCRNCWARPRRRRRWSTPADDE